MFLATIAASGVLIWLARLALVPWLVAAIFILLPARAVWYLTKHSRLTARQLGFMELFLGVAVVLATAIAWRF